MRAAAVAGLVRILRPTEDLLGGGGLALLLGEGICTSIQEVPVQVRWWQ